jgi:hypothetical protein
MSTRVSAHRNRSVPAAHGRSSALDVTEVTQSLPEGLQQVGTTDRVIPQQAYSSDLGRLLRLGGERRCEEAASCRHKEHPSVDHSIT